MKKISLLGFLITLFFAEITAQTTSTENAFSSQHGIFIRLENDYPKIDMKALPVYEIKRKGANDKSFKSIATIKVPADYATFVENIKAAAQVNPEPLLMKEINTELLWKKFVSGGYDSLMAYRNALFLQLALGIKYFDASAEKNIIYQYEITKKVKATNAENVFTTNSISYPAKAEKYPGKLRSEKETVIGIALNYTCVGYAPALIRLYREENYSGNFLPIRARRIKIADGDTTVFAIYDTIVKPNSVYRYYILPMDYYGNYGSINDTITTIAASEQYAGNIEKMDVVSLLNEGTAIRWRLSEPQNFNYVAVYRTTNFDSTLTKIGMASAADSQFVDNNAEPMKMYFYALQPITRMGATLPMSAKVTGMFTPISQPLAPYITDIQSTEKSINLTIKNNDVQTRGYRIYRKLNTDSTFALISELIKVEKAITSYIDTQNIAADKYYTYMVKAENKSYVLSPASNILTVRSAKSGELITMGVPKVEMINGRAMIQWNNNIQRENIQSFQIYRKDESGKEILLKENIDPQIINYSDSTIAVGHQYNYGIAYRDNNGNRSAIAYSKSTSIPNTQRGPSNAYAASKDNTLILSWTEDDIDVTAYRIYKLVEEKPVLISEINAGSNTYTIKNMKPGEGYNIYLTTVNKNKTESLPGKMLMGVVE